MNRPVALPPIQEERLANGARVWVAARAGVPLAAVRLLVRAGAALDPAARFGLAHLVSEAARRGTRRRTGPRIDDEIESLGAELGVGVDEDAAYFGLSAPSEFLPKLLDMVVDVATAPTFPTREVDRLRRREIASLTHDLDEPSVVADRAMLAAAFGSHPYGHAVEGRVSHLRRVRRADAVDFHARWYGPDSATLIVVGAVDAGEAAGICRRRLAGWRPGAATPPQLPPPERVPRTVWVVDKPDATQSQVRIAVPALPRATPSYFPAVVANTVFGGGFTSRLMQAIRVNRGLSYGARSRFAMSRAGGLFFISTFTKNESVSEVVQVALEEVDRFCDEGPTAEELDRAKSYLCGIFALTLETHDQVAEKLSDLALYGIPLDEVIGYRERVRAVPAEECREVARRYFPRTDGAIIAVGPAKDLAPALERLGPVVVIPARKVV